MLGLEEWGPAWSIRQPHLSGGIGPSVQSLYFPTTLKKPCPNGGYPPGQSPTNQLQHTKITGAISSLSQVPKKFFRSISDLIKG